jgi:hypothetical protein
VGGNSGDIALDLLADILGPVEVIATGPPDSPLPVTGTAPAAVRPRPCTGRPGARCATGAERTALRDPPRPPGTPSRPDAPAGGANLGGRPQMSIISSVRLRRRPGPASGSAATPRLISAGRQDKARDAGQPGGGPDGGEAGQVRQMPTISAPMANPASRQPQAERGTVTGHRGDTGAVHGGQADRDGIMPVSLNQGCGTEGEQWTGPTTTRARRRTSTRWVAAHIISVSR